MIELLTPEQKRMFFYGKSKGNEGKSLTDREVIGLINCIQVDKPSIISMDDHYKDVFEKYNINPKDKNIDYLISRLGQMDPLM